MSQIEKIISRLLSKPKDFTYDEAKRLLNHYGFYEDTKGKTSGSRVQFVNSYGVNIILHRPHPSNILKLYQIEDLIDYINEWRK